MHVSRIEPGRVCYSKILSFILLVLDPREGQEDPKETPKIRDSDEWDRQARDSQIREKQMRDSRITDSPQEYSHPNQAVSTESALELGRILRRWENKNTFVNSSRNGEICPNLRGPIFIDAEYDGPLSSKERCPTVF